MVEEAVYEIDRQFPIKVKDCKLKLLTLDRLDDYIKLIRSREFNKNIRPKMSRFSFNKMYEILADRVMSYGKENKSLEYRAVLVNDEESIIGTFTIYFEADFMEIAYFVKREYRGKGYGSSMIASVLEKLPLAEFGIQRVRARVLADNTLSCKVLLKNLFLLCDCSKQDNDQEVIEFVKEVPV